MTWLRRETFLFYSLKFLQLKMFSRPRCYISSYCVIDPIRPFPFQKKGNCASLKNYASLHSLPGRSGEARLPWSDSTSLWAICRHENLTCLVKVELTSLLLYHWWNKMKSSPRFCSIPSSFQSRLPMDHFPFAGSS